MKKKLAMLILIFFISFVCYSCLDYSLPNRVEVELEGALGFPVKTSYGNWASAIIKSLGDTLPMGIKIYNVNYGQDVQAFCVYVPIEISDTLNPQEYMDEGIDDLLTKTQGKAALEINRDFSIPSFADFVFTVERQIPVSGGVISVPITIDLSSGDGSGTDQADINNGFLYAVIEKGAFTVELNLSGAGLTEDQFTKAYDITITQEPDTSSAVMSPCPGLDSKSNSAEQSLSGKDINSNPIKVGGTITLTPGSGITVSDSGTLNVEVKIKLNVSSYRELFWDFSEFSGLMDDADPVSLADVAGSLYWLEFGKCYNDSGTPIVNSDGDPTAGIGINMYFDKLSPALESQMKMSVVCKELHFAENNAKLLCQGNNVFGNNDALENDTKLLLNNSLEPAPAPDAVTQLTFEFKLLSAYENENVLRLAMVEAGTELVISGAAKFFQNWKKAAVNMKNALKENSSVTGGFSDGTFGGGFPDTAKGEKPIDLSILNKYLAGFSFKAEDVAAKVYLSGPDNTAIQSLNLNTMADTKIKIDAYYNAGDTVTILPENKLILDKKHVVIEQNTDDYIKNGSYKLPDLPEGGNSIENFDKIINAKPKNLSFKFEGRLPEVLIVIPEMFMDITDNARETADAIAAAVLMKINLRLTADNDGSKIMFPEMFEGKKDLLGRDSLAEDSVFTSVNVEYLKLTVDFAGTFFTGATLFLEQDSAKMLFPKGITIDGSAITVDINNNNFEFINNNFIKPDLRLEFKKDATISVPRNMGLTGFKIEAKGKNTLKLDL